MDSGPTTVGAIVAKLRMDRDQWVADMQRTKTDARELGALEPKIKIDADVSTALAKLEQVRAAAEAAGVHTTSSVTATSIPASGSVPSGAAARVDAVAAAEVRLAAAESASESATARAIVAEMRLDEVRSKGRQTAVQLAAAELAASEAIKRSEAAALKAVAAEEALGAAQRKAAEAALAEAGAEDVKAGATTKANNANATSVSRIGLIIAALAMLLPMAAPLAGFTAGVAGGFTMMSISGIAAIKGIHDEMKAGTDLGAVYGQGIQALKGDLDQLTHTGAVDMLSSFAGVQAQLTDHMPMLNRQVSEFSQIAGHTGSNLFAGALTGLQVLEPLLLTAGGYVEALSRGFLSWTQNGGLTKFGDYATSVLPQVATVLGDLTTGVISVLTAMAPFGTVMLGVVDGLANFLTWGAQSGPIFAEIVGGATAGVLAFKLWAGLAPILEGVATAVGAVGVAAEIASGPIGWIIGGIAAMAAVIAVSTVSTDQATSSMNTYTSALAADNGVIGENVRAQTAKNLIDAGAVEKAKQLGISAKTLTDAAMGQVPAMKSVADAVKKADAAYSSATVSNLGWRGATSKGAVALKGQKDAADGVAAAVKAQNDAIQYAIKYGIDYNAAMQLGGSVAETMAAGLGMTVDAYERLVGAQNNATASAKTWKTEMDILNGVAQTLEQTNIALATDYQNMESSVTASIKKLGKAKATDLSLDSAAGIANHSMVLTRIQDAQAQSDALVASEVKSGKSEVTAHNDARAALIKHRAELIDQMVQLGFNRKAVTDLVDSEMTIPAYVKSQVEIETAAAAAKIAALKADMAGIQRVITVRVNTILTGATNPNRTFGLGDGGINLTSKPKKAGGGTVFGPGTASSDSVPHLLSTGEEVISNMRGQADKYRPLLKAINAGHVPQTMMASSGAASPAVMGGATHSGRGGNNIHVTLNNPVSRNPVEDARIAGQILNASIHV
jgi:hypothetical protein